VVLEYKGRCLQWVLVVNYELESNLEVAGKQPVD
jgi:hypothetical protein